MDSDSRLRRVLERLDGAKDIALHEAMRLLPSKTASDLGAGLASLSLRFRNADKVGRAMAALAHIRPEMNEAERRAMAVANPATPAGRSPNSPACTASGTRLASRSSGARTSPPPTPCSHSSISETENPEWSRLAAWV